VAPQVAASICATRSLAADDVVIAGTVPLDPPVPLHWTCHSMVAVTGKAASSGRPSGDGMPMDDRT
jgi:hypothetical protein